MKTSGQPDYAGVKIYAVRIFVTDLDQAVAFYSGTLGLEPGYRNDDIGWAEVEAGGCALGLERVGSGDADGTALVGRFTGISLQVDDIQAEFQRMTSAGVAFDSPPETQDWGGVLAHFRDPDGNVLTLLGGA